MFHLYSQLKMGSAIVDLWQLLLSKKEQEPITIQEANLLMKWQSQTLRNSMIGFSGAAIVSMLVTPRRLNIFVRGSLSLGTSIVCALWNFGRSLESWNDHFLSLEGSRMQRELADIMLKRYRYDPWVLQRLSKHFYLEEVYEDSSADKPKFLWQSRYFYGDPASDFQNTSYNDIKTDSSKNDAEKTTVESKEVYVNTAADDSQNPFDFVFGLPGSAENIPPKTSSTSPGRSSLRERRSRRRHRSRHQEDSDV
ncbi:uncharacterized protein [Primulina huaijiensis]|uniref:uncharacterized protein isoform X2 n=2 Tax=Primulina huaijiensis TaxID=1492673 RepID=UPI003CC782B6